MRCIKDQASEIDFSIWSKDLQSKCSIFRTTLKGTGLNVDPETHNANIIIYIYVIMSFY